MFTNEMRTSARVALKNNQFDLSTEIFLDTCVTEQTNHRTKEQITFDLYGWGDDYNAKGKAYIKKVEDWIHENYVMIETKDERGGYSVYNWVDRWDFDRINHFERMNKGTYE